MAALYGFIWGFALCFTFGPAFFAIIQVSIDSSAKKGLVMSIGVVVADAILIFFGIFGTAMLPQIHYFSEIISIIGVVFLVAMGLISIFKTQNELIYPTSKIGNIAYFFTKGLVLNITNPANFILILSTCTYLRVSFKYDTSHIITFFLASLVATFIAQLGIAFYSNNLKNTISKALVQKINMIAGMAFIVLAIKLLWNQLVS